MGRQHSNHIHTTRRRRRAAVGLALVGALTITACAGDDDDAAGSAEPVADEAIAEMTVEEAAAQELDSGGEQGDSIAAEAAGTDFDIGVIGRDVIVEMRVVLSSDDIQRTVASVMAAASTLGGGLASSDVNYGTAGEFGSDGFAVLVVKVPPASVDRLLDGLDDTATVQSINQSAQDVTEQLIDLDVRIQNARQSVTNVREFMDRTENLDDLVTLEAELTRRQTELERLEAQERNLSDRVALSTITIEIVPTASVPEPVVEEDQTISDAFRSGWTAFTALLFGLGYVFAATLPFLIAGLLIAVMAWVIVRRRDASPATPQPGHPAAGPDGPEESADEREPELTG